jgi:hypothetical protein
MSGRRLAVLVAFAVIAGAVVAGVGLATEGSSKPKHVLQIDEVRGRVGAVVLGETSQNVVGALGAPLSNTSLGVSPTQILSYPNLKVGIRNGRVVTITTTDEGAATLKVVRIGDPISSVRALYRKKSHCIPNTPDKTAPNPHCRVTVPAGVMIVRGDPIASIELVKETSTERG